MSCCGRGTAQRAACCSEELIITFLTKHGQFLAQVVFSLIGVIFSCAMLWKGKDEDAGIYLPVLTGIIGYWVPSPKATTSAGKQELIEKTQQQSNEQAATTPAAETPGAGPPGAGTPGAGPSQIELAAPGSQNITKRKQGNAQGKAKTETDLEIGVDQATKVH